MVAVLRDTFAHGAGELVVAVAADTVGFIRRDVSGVNIAERRGELQPARQRRAVRSRMAGHAVACSRHIFPTRHLLRARLRRPQA